MTDHSSEQDGAPGRGLARALGLLSLGLGLASVLRPGEVARLTGVDDEASAEAALQAVGVQELSVVPGLLLRRQPTGWLWQRVAGDVVHLALLGRTLDGKRGERRTRTLATLGAVAGIAVLDLTAARRSGRVTGALHLTAAVTVNKPVDEAYAFWRRLENLPTFMAHLQEVRTGDGAASTWQSRAPLGSSISWQAEVVDDVPGERIAWRSVGRTAVPNSGDVAFTRAPGGRGTEVRVHLDYRLPGGRAGATVARLLGDDPHQQVEDDLRRFKQVLETGEVVRSDGSPGGTDARRQTLQRPAHPVSSR